MNKTLAFWRKADEIAVLVAAKRGIVVLPTGCGKTTQAPQLLHDLGYTRKGIVYISVPKRVLAVELASRVAQEMRVELGDLVGYSIRGENRASRQTRILFVTEGMLQAKILSNPTLEGVSVILFDEFHERSLNSDFNVSLVERAQQQGWNGSFLLLSATIDSTALAHHFCCGVVDGSELLTMFPIEQRYVADVVPTKLYEEAANQAASLIAERGGNGLIFMPGKAEINGTIDALKRLLPEVLIFPLHGELEPAERHAPFVERSEATITVASDIVETGATLPGIYWVVDSGSARETRYDALADVSSLRLVPVAKDRLQQRKGRCGRVQPGIYVGLFSEEDFRQRADKSLPEILRVPLRAVVLAIKKLGLTREESPINFIDNPSKEAWKKAKRQLQYLNLVEEDSSAAITELGEKAAELGCDPREAVMLFEAARLGCLQEMAYAIASMQSRRLLYVPRNVEERPWAEQAHAAFRKGTLCDAWTTIEVLRASEHHEESLGKWCRSMYVSYVALRDIRLVAHQLQQDVRRMRSANSTQPGTEEMLCRAIGAGFPDRQFVNSFGDWYEEVDGEQSVRLARESGIRPEEGQRLVAWELRDIQGRGGRMMRLITNAALIMK